MLNTHKQRIGHSCPDGEQEIDEYIEFFNEQRPAYSLGYLTPKQYKDSFAPSVV